MMMKASYLLPEEEQTQVHNEVCSMRVDPTSKCVAKWQLDVSLQKTNEGRSVEGLSTSGVQLFSVRSWNVIHYMKQIEKQL